MTFSAAVLEAQKPSITLIPAVKNQKVPEAVIDMNYYNGNVREADCNEDSLGMYQENDAGKNDNDIDVSSDSSKNSGRGDLSRSEFTRTYEIRLFSLFKLIPFIISFNILHFKIA